MTEYANWTGSRPVEMRTEKNVVVGNMGYSWSVQTIFQLSLYGNDRHYSGFAAEFFGVYAS